MVLHKGDVIPIKLKNQYSVLNVGFGWNSKADIDSSAHLINDLGVVQDCICFHNRESNGVSLLDRFNAEHGELIDDVERINIDLNRLPEWCMGIVFCINIFSLTGLHLFSKKSLSGTQTYISLKDSETDDYLGRYELPNLAPSDAYCMAVLQKSNEDKWCFKIVANGMHGQIRKLKKQISGMEDLLCQYH